MNGAIACVITDAWYDICFFVSQTVLYLLRGMHELQIDN